MSQGGDDRSRRSRTLGTRMVGVAGFNRAVYDDIDRDPFAQFQSQQVVLLAAVSTLIGLVVGGPGVGLAGAIVIGVRWYAMSDIVARLGVRWFPAQADLYTRRRASRLLGFAHAPLLLAFLFPIPIIGPVFWVVINTWSIAAMALGIRLTLRWVPVSRIAWLLVAAAIPQLVLLFLAI